MIRRVRLAGTNLDSSCLGFGCASLGSRISAATGLAALLRAHEAGVDWYDVAPAYGGGDAESVLAPFLKGRRSHLHVLTKVGLSAPAAGVIRKAAVRVARPGLALLTGLRARVRQTRMSRPLRVEITPALVEDSISNSLRRLGTDHVDVLALHDPDPASVTDPAVVRALERVIALGQARYVGVAGDLAACRAGAVPGLPYAVFQTQVVPGLDIPGDLARRAGRPVAVIGHSVFGIPGAPGSPLRRLLAHPSARARLAAAGYAGPDLRREAARLLLDAALAANPDGITLASLFAAPTADDNFERARRAPNPAATALLGHLLSANADILDARAG